MKETCTWLVCLSTACHKQPKEKNTCMGIRNEYKKLSKINHFKEKQKNIPQSSSAGQAKQTLLEIIIAHIRKTVNQ